MITIVVHTTLEMPFYSESLVFSDEITASGDASVGDVNIDLLRATEYEQLSRLCMDEKQYVLSKFFGPYIVTLL